MIWKKTFHPSTLFCFQNHLIQKRRLYWKSKLRSSDDKELENSEILIDTDSIFPEFAQASRLTEEDYLNRSTTNAFYNMSEEILQKVEKKYQVLRATAQKRFCSSTLVEKSHKLYMPTLSLWSNLLIGDLSRHGSSPVYQSYVNSTKQILGNTSIERKFKVFKNTCITFGGKLYIGWMKFIYNYKPM